MATDNTQDNEPITELTEREIAIAEGRDPDKLETSDVTEDDEGTDAPEDDAGGSSEDSSGSAEGSAEPEEPDGADDSGATASDRTWVDEDVRALAASYSLTQEDLDGFDSLADFRKATKVLDRNLTAAGRSVQPAPQHQQKPQPKGPAPTAPQSPVLVDPQKYIDAGYDEETVNAMKALRALQERNQALEREHAELKQFVTASKQQRMVEFEHQRVTAFHDAVDQLDGDRYGSSVDKAGNPAALSQQADANRRRLHGAATALLAGIVETAKRAGKQPVIPSLPVILKRAEQIEFGAEIQAEERKKFQEKVSQQSRRRRPAAGRGVTRIAPRPRNTAGNDLAKSIANDPDIVKFWNDIAT